MSIRLNPYLIFDGNTKEAIHFYEKALGGEIKGIMTYGDIPQDPEHPLVDPCACPGNRLPSRMLVSTARFAQPKPDNRGQ